MLGLNKIIKRFVPHHEVPKYMNLADFGITPFIPVPSKRYGTPIKTGEYLAMGLPTVITKDISDDSDFISHHNIGAIIDPLTKKGYKSAILKIDDLLMNWDRKDLRLHIAKLAKGYRNFSIADDVSNLSKVVLRLECISCKYKMQMSLKRCKHFELGGDRKTKGQALQF